MLLYPNMERLDILVNNAGIFDELIPVGEVSDDLWYKVNGNQPECTDARYS